MKTTLIARLHRARSSAIVSPIRYLAGALVLATLVAACGGGNGTDPGNSSNSGNPAGASSPSGGTPNSTPASAAATLHCAP